MDKQNNNEKIYNFEQFRNRTDFYDILQDWNQKTKREFESNQDFKYIFAGYFQYQTLKYMSGIGLGSIPRGLLLYHQMGSGKTIEAIATALYATSVLKRYNQNKVGNIVIMTPGSLKEKTILDIQKYLNKLIKFNLGLDLQKKQQPISIDQVMQQFIYVVMNDTVNLSDNFSAIFDLPKLKNHFIIIDEAHNLFRGMNNGNHTAVKIYNQLVSEQNIQLLFLTGSAVGTNARELAFCFQMLSKNPNLFQTNLTLRGQHFEANKAFDEFFIQEQQNSAKLQRKTIFIKRIAGLCSFYRQKLQGNQLSQMPNLNELQVIPVKIQNKTILQTYYAIKDSEKKGKYKDSFLIQYRLLLNSCLDIDGNIVSDKFKTIEQKILENIGSVQVVYSDFVQKGIEMFIKYCNQGDKQKNWREFDPNQPKQQNEVIYCFIHGSIPIEQRQLYMKYIQSGDNNYGQFIDVILLGPAGAEGINIYNARFVHIMEPQWAQSAIEQIIYRAVRQGSHRFLEQKDRNVTPYLYMAYVDIDINLSDIQQVRENYDKLCADQIIQLKSMKKFEVIQQFCQLLQLASINCCDFIDLLVENFREKLGLLQLENPCFKCQSNGLQLFDPNSMEKDVQNHNCIRQSIEFNDNVIEINHVRYGWYQDIYSIDGYQFYEIRNNNLIPEHVEIYHQLIQKLKEHQQKIAQNSTPVTELKQLIFQNAQNEYLIPENKEINVTFVSNQDILSQQKNAINLSGNSKLKQLLPSYLNISLEQQFVTFEQLKQIKKEVKDQNLYFKSVIEQKQPLVQKLKKIIGQSDQILVIKPTILSKEDQKMFRYLINNI